MIFTIIEIWVDIKQEVRFYILFVQSYLLFIIIMVKSIDDMLIKAYEYIDKNPMLQKFLQNSILIKQLLASNKIALEKNNY